MFKLTKLSCGNIYLSSLHAINGECLLFESTITCHFDHGYYIKKHQLNMLNIYYHRNTVINTKKDKIICKTPNLVPSKRKSVQLHINRSV